MPILEIASCSTRADEVPKILRRIYAEVGTAGSSNKTGKPSYVIGLVKLSKKEIKVMRRYVQEHHVDIERDGALNEILYMANFFVCTSDENPRPSCMLTVAVLPSTSF